MRKLLPLVLTATLAACSAGSSPDAAAWVHACAEASARAEADPSAAGREALRQLLALPVPSAVHSEDRRRVRQDAFARLARRAASPALALRHAEAGLAEGAGAEDFFVAELHAARGAALEALGQDREAADAYATAARIQDRLLGEALVGPESPRETP
jgi:hypothetical protein